MNNPDSARRVLVLGVREMCDRAWTAFGREDYDVCLTALRDIETSVIAARGLPQKIPCLDPADCTCTPPFSCTRADHEELRLDDARWSMCVLVGTQPSGENTALELRNCPECKTTLAREVEG